MSSHPAVFIFICSWLLYELPGFQGRTVALEEGPIELQNMWVEPEPPGLAMPTSPMKIGSIRLAVRVSDSRLACKHLRMQPANLITVSHISYYMITIIYLIKYLV